MALLPSHADHTNNVPERLPETDGGVPRPPVSTVGPPDHHFVLSIKNDSRPIVNPNESVGPNQYAEPPQTFYNNLN
jgi:hypothetical protein